MKASGRVKHLLSCEGLKERVSDMSDMIMTAHLDFDEHNEEGDEVGGKWRSRENSASSVCLPKTPGELAKDSLAPH